MSLHAIPARRAPLSILAAALLTLLAACTTDPYTGERQAARTGIGAGLGAGIGAAAGAIFGGGKGALIGAGAGALAGGAVGGYMDAQEAELRRELRDSGVSVTREGDKIVLNMPGNITFNTDSARLQDQFTRTLNSVGKVLNEYPKTMIDIVGHTDSTGPEDYNQRLSEDRAASVRNYLLARGIRAQRIVARGLGESAPVASNETAEGRAQNRRVELALVPIREQS